MVKDKVEVDRKLLLTVLDDWLGWYEDYRDLLPHEEYSKTHADVKQLLKDMHKKEK